MEGFSSTHPMRYDYIREGKAEMLIYMTRTHEV